jgi:hypothetical protein
MNAQEMLSYIENLLAEENAKAATAEALEASIKHWEELSAAQSLESVNIGSKACALCLLFNTEDNRCAGCPVREKSNLRFCLGTPYSRAADALRTWNNAIDYPDHGYPKPEIAAEQFREAAREEVKFLKSLLPPEPEV